MNLDAQPDYGSWPHDPENPTYYRGKKALIDQAYENWTYGTFTENDFLYLHSKTVQFWQLFHFASNFKLEVAAELFAKDLEIEELKRQLEVAKHGE